MYNEVSDEFIINTLKYFSARSSQIAKEQFDIYEESAGLNESVIREPIYPDLDNDKIRDNVFNVRDLSDLYNQYLAMTEQRLLDLKMISINLTEEQESMNRIMTIFLILPADEKEILNYLYMQQPDKKISIATNELAEKTFTSPRTIMRKRKKAVSYIKDIYKSDLTQAEIFKMTLPQNKNKVYR